MSRAFCRERRELVSMSAIGRACLTKRTDVRDLMAFIPTYCDECSRSALIHADFVQASVAVCTSCGFTARVVPGSAFRREDVLPYRALADAIKEAGIGPLIADELTEEITSATYLVAGPMLRHLAKTVPALAFLDLIANAAPQVVRKTETMIKTIMRGIAIGRRQSGFFLMKERLRSRTGD
jgi:hypothetical protein